VDVVSFALKVSRWCGFGFAAGCEAVAMPRLEVPFTFLGYALDAAFGGQSEGLGPDQGIALQ
jgi:hypothetical protein